MDSNIDQNTNNFKNIINSGALTGNVNDAFGALKPILQYVTFIMALLAIVALILLMFRITCDILLIANPALAHSDSKGNVFGKYITKFSSFDHTAEMEAHKNEHLTFAGYVKGHLLQVLLSFALIGIIATGQLMPIAANLTGFGAGLIHQFTNGVSQIGTGSAPSSVSSGVTSNSNKPSQDQVNNAYRQKSVLQDTLIKETDPNKKQALMELIKQQDNIINAGR